MFLIENPFTRKILNFWDTGFGTGFCDLNLSLKFRCETVNKVNEKSKETSILLFHVFFSHLLKLKSTRVFLILDKNSISVVYCYKLLEWLF